MKNKNIGNDKAVQRKWTLQPEGHNFNYCGDLFLSPKVIRETSSKEQKDMFNQLAVLTLNKPGLGCRQKFISNKGEIIYIIDNVSIEELQSGKYGEEHNYVTMIFADEL